MLHEGGRRVLKKWSFMVTLCLSLLVFIGCQSGDSLEDALNWPVDDFTFTDQNGDPVGLADLKGKVWLADFIFTNCTTVCTPMTANMVDVQQKVKEAGLDVTIVSFSVDPDRDTPEALTEYGKQFNVDFSNWFFLTGFSQEEIAKIAKDNFKTIVQDDPNSDQVVHGTNFYLINQDGVIVKQYDGLEPPIDEIINDIKSLTK